MADEIENGGSRWQKYTGPPPPEVNPRDTSIRQPALTGETPAGVRLLP